MSTSVQKPSVKLMKICPKCAMDQLGPHQRGYRTCARSGGSFGDRCGKCLACLKRWSHHPEDITLLQILVVVYRIIVAAITALVGLALAMLPLAEFLLLLSLYIAECISWTLQEPKFGMCLAKGVVTLVFVLVLGYVACFLLHSLMLPTIYLVTMIVRVAKSYV